MSAAARPVQSMAAGLAHVAALSFLAARAAPPLGFPLGLAGGVALARAGQRLGARYGYGVSLAAVLELVAIVGPARLGGPLTQALTAPLVGRLEARGVARSWQVVTCLGVRFAYHAAAYAFFIWVVLGGLDAYAGTYDSLLGHLPFVPRGAPAALAVTGIALLTWGVFAATVQVYFYGRGLRRWFAPGAGGAARAASPPRPRPAPPAPRRFDPRAVAVGAIIAFAILLAGTRPYVLGAVAVWLAAAWAAARPDRHVVVGAAWLSLALAAGALAFTVVGGMGVGVGLERAARAALLVWVAAWLRGAAGFPGLREVTRRALGRLRRLPALPETISVLDKLGPGREVGASARALVGSMGAVPRRPLPLVDAVLAWIANESSRFYPVPVRAPELRLRTRDVVLILLSSAPALAFLA